MSYHDFLKRFLTIALTIVLLLGIWQLRSILLLGFLAFIVAVAINVPVTKLRERGVHRGVAITVSVIGVFGILTLLALWIFPAVTVELANLIAAVPDALREAATAYQEWRRANEPLQMLLPSLDPAELVSEVQASLNLQEGDFSNVILGVLNSTLPLLQGIGNIVFGIAANLAIVIFVSIFFLVQPMDYVKSILLLVPQEYQERALAIIAELHFTLTNWITAQSLSISITAFLVWFILGIVLGMPNAVAVAVIAGLATFIPNIGVLLPLIPIAIFTIADDPGQLWIIVPVYLLIQLIESNILTPSIVRVELNIPSGAVLLFQVISASLFGALGVLLAVPLLAVIITLVREVYTYDILGMRNLEIEVKAGDNNTLRLHKRPKRPEPERTRPSLPRQAQTENAPTSDDSLPPESASNA